MSRLTPADDFKSLVPQVLLHVTNHLVNVFTAPLFRYSSQSMKSMHLKWTILWLSVYSQVVVCTHHCQFQNVFITSTKNPEESGPVNTARLSCPHPIAGLLIRLCFCTCASSGHFLRKDPCNMWTVATGFPQHVSGAIPAAARQHRTPFQGCVIFRGSG